MNFSAPMAIAGLLVASLVDILPASHAQTISKPTVRVAIFTQPNFPTYGVSSLVSPRQIARDLQSTGVVADLLDADALASSDRLNIKQYAAVVLPYGNTYPADAFENLRRFHQNGGSLVTTGIPFTHAAARRAARNWEASPRWGASVQLAPNEGARPGTAAIRIQTEGQGTTGISSHRFAVRPGDRAAVSLAIRELTLPRTRLSRRNANSPAEDNLYIRFFDANGKYLEQQAVVLPSVLTTWKTVQVEAVVPAQAAYADLSMQLHRAGHLFFASDFSARVNDMAVRLANADLTEKTEVFLDLGHQEAPALWGPKGIGIGGFAGPALPNSPTSQQISSGDPLHLSALFARRPPAPVRNAPQWLDPRSVPSGVRVVPAVGTAQRPLIALLVQEKGEFQGAVDAWTYRVPEGDREDYYACQVIARATIAALARRGVLDKTREAVAYRKLEAQPRPPLYANLTLPQVPRRYETFQPKMPPPARHLYVADIRNLTKDEKLFLISLQGIVNRKQPRIYFLFDDDDARWLETLQQQKETDEPIAVSDPWSLVNCFRAEYKGAVVCDPKVYVSPCLAVSLAGADDLLVAMTPQLAKRANVPVKVDLRGRFKDDAAALRFLRTSVMPRLDPYLTCTLDPAVFHQGALDSIIAARGSVFWITGPEAQQLPGADSFQEVAEVSAMLAKMPLGAVVRGFWWHGDGIGLQESDGVALGSRLGKVTLVSDLINNLSVHSGVRATRLVQKPRPAAPPLDRNKVYVAFTMSDGDNLCTWRGYFRRYFDDPVRGSIPVGWGMSPAILDLAPGWARWYYENATPNDEFICDVSGVAYMYPSSWATSLKDRNAAFRWFYGRTEDYMKRTDMNTIRLMDVDAADIARVGPLLPGIAYLMPDYGHAGGTRYAEMTYALPSGQSVFRAVTSGSGPEHLAEQIRAHASGNRPAFVNAFIWNWGSSLGDLKRTMEILGPNYVAVTPSQLNALHRQGKP